MQQKYIPRCISHVSLSFSLSLTRSLILGLYMFVHISMMNIIVSFFHFFTLSREFFHCWNSSFFLLLRHLLSSFFCYKRWNFSSIEITAAAAAFFCGTRKEKFSVSFHCLVCVCHEDDDEKAEKTTSSSSSYSSSREMRFREWWWKTMFFKSNASEW